MALRLDTFMGQLRSSLLRDENMDKNRWSDPELLIYVGWALDTFADHTAVASATSYTPASDTEFTLPSNLFTGEGFDAAGMVYVEDGDSIWYLDPIRFNPELDVIDDEGFYTYPENTLHVNHVMEPGSTSILHVRYFAFYDHPIEEEDVINIPQWGHTAFSYLVAAHALSGPSLKTANVRTWNRKEDSGMPEHNPAQKLQTWFFQLYEREMLRHKPQDRRNFYHRVPR